MREDTVAQGQAGAKSASNSTCLTPLGPQWAEEVPDSSEECEWSHRGAAGEQGGMELAACGSACATP